MSNDNLKHFMEGNAARIIIRLNPFERDAQSAFEFSKRKAEHHAIDDGFISAECLKCHCFNVEHEVVRNHMLCDDEVRTTFRCNSRTIFRPSMCPVLGVPSDLTTSIANLTSQISSMGPSIKASASAISSLSSRVSDLYVSDRKAESWDGYFEDSGIISEPKPPKKTPEELQKELEEGSDELAGITKDMPRSGGVAW